jgi:pre-mRNA branch site protein p14
MLCSGNDKGTRGTAYVVYEDIYDAKQALEHLGGFNVQNRYLILQVREEVVQSKTSRFVTI